MLASVGSAISRIRNMLWRTMKLWVWAAVLQSCLGAVVPETDSWDLFWAHHSAALPPHAACIDRDGAELRTAHEGGARGPLWLQRLPPPERRLPLLALLNVSLTSAAKALRQQDQRAGVPRLLISARLVRLALDEAFGEGAGAQSALFPAERAVAQTVGVPVVRRLDRLVTAVKQQTVRLQPVLKQLVRGNQLRNGGVGAARWVAGRMLGNIQLPPLLLSTAGLSAAEIQQVPLTAMQQVPLTAMQQVHLTARTEVIDLCEA